MKRFFRKLLYFLPVPAIIIFTSYIVDPANLYNDKYISNMATYMSKGYNITDVTFNYNDHLFVKSFIQQVHICPNELVLGSSRVMEINQTLTKDSSTVTHGMSAATLEDLLAIYYIYEKKGCKIQKILLGVEPWYLNDNHTCDKWKALEDEYRLFAGRLIHSDVSRAGLIQYKYSKYSELFSISYFKESIKYFRKRVPKRYRATYTDVNKDFTLLKDGSVSWNAYNRNAPLEERRKNAESITMGNPVYTLDNYTHLSEYYTKLFEAFVSYLQQQHIKVAFYMGPYNPIVYDYFKRTPKYNMVLAAEQYYRNFAAVNDIKVIGSYDPSRYNIDESYFYDGLHVNKNAIGIIFSADSNASHL